MADKAKAGNFEAAISDYGVMKSKSGLPMAMIRFQIVDNDGDNHFLTWYGTFKEGKAAEITSEALAVCGMTSNNPADLAKGGGSGVLKDGGIVSITVKMEEWEGKVRPKIAYINPPGGAGFRDSMEHGEAVQMFAGMNLGGVMAEARKKHAPKNHAPGANGETPF